MSVHNSLHCGVRSASAGPSILRGGGSAIPSLSESVPLTVREETEPSIGGSVVEEGGKRVEGFLPLDCYVELVRPRGGAVEASSGVGGGSASPHGGCGGDVVLNFRRRDRAGNGKAFFLLVHDGLLRQLRGGERGARALAAAHQQQFVEREEAERSVLESSQRRSDTASPTGRRRNGTMTLSRYAYYSTAVKTEYEHLFGDVLPANLTASRAATSETASLASAAAPPSSPARLGGRVLPLSAGSGSARLVKSGHSSAAAGRNGSPFSPASPPGSSSPQTRTPTRLPPLSPSTGGGAQNTASVSDGPNTSTSAHHQGVAGKRSSSSGGSAVVRNTINPPHESVTTIYDECLRDPHRLKMVAVQSASMLKHSGAIETGFTMVTNGCGSYRLRSDIIPETNYKIVILVEYDDEELLPPAMLQAQQRQREEEALTKDQRARQHATMMDLQQRDRERTQQLIHSRQQQRGASMRSNSAASHYGMRMGSAGPIHSQGGSFSCGDDYAGGLNNTTSGTVRSIGRPHALAGFNSRGGAANASSLGRRVEGVDGSVSTPPRSAASKVSVVHSEGDHQEQTMPPGAPHPGVTTASPQYKVNSKGQRINKFGLVVKQRLCLVPCVDTVQLRYQTERTRPVSTVATVKGMSPWQYPFLLSTEHAQTLAAAYSEFIDGLLRRNQQSGRASRRRGGAIGKGLGEADDAALLKSDAYLAAIDAYQQYNWADESDDDDDGGSGGPASGPPATSTVTDVRGAVVSFNTPGGASHSKPSPAIRGDKAPPPFTPSLLDARITIRGVADPLCGRYISLIQTVSEAFHKRRWMMRCDARQANGASSPVGHGGGGDGHSSGHTATRYARQGVDAEVIGRFSDIMRLGAGHFKGVGGMGRASNGFGKKQRRGTVTPSPARGVRAGSTPARAGGSTSSAQPSGAATPNAGSMSTLSPYLHHKSGAAQHHPQAQAGLLLEPSSFLGVSASFRSTSSPRVGGGSGRGFPPPLSPRSATFHSPRSEYNGTPLRGDQTPPPPPPILAPPPPMLLEELSHLESSVYPPAPPMPSPGTILECMAALGCAPQPCPDLKGPWVLDWYDFVLLASCTDESVMRRLGQMAAQYNGYEMEGETLLERLRWMCLPEKAGLPALDPSSGQKKNKKRGGGAENSAASPSVSGEVESGAAITHTVLHGDDGNALSVSSEDENPKEGCSENERDAAAASFDDVAEPSFRVAPHSSCALSGGNGGNNAVPLLAKKGSSAMFVRSLLIHDDHHQQAPCDDASATVDAVGIGSASTPAKKALPRWHLSNHLPPEDEPLTRAEVQWRNKTLATFLYATSGAWELDAAAHKVRSSNRNASAADNARGRGRPASSSQGNLRASSASSALGGGGASHRHRARGGALLLPEGFAGAAFCAVGRRLLQGDGQQEGGADRGSSEASSPLSPHSGRAFPSTGRSTRSTTAPLPPRPGSGHHRQQGGMHTGRSAHTSSGSTTGPFHFGPNGPVPPPPADRTDEQLHRLLHECATPMTSTLAHAVGPDGGSMGETNGIPRSDAPRVAVNPLSCRFTAARAIWSLMSLRQQQRAAFYAAPSAVTTIFPPPPPMKRGRRRRSLMMGDYYDDDEDGSNENSSRDGTQSGGLLGIHAGSSDNYTANRSASSAFGGGGWGGASAARGDGRGFFINSTAERAVEAPRALPTLFHNQVQLAREARLLEVAETALPRFNRAVKTAQARRRFEAWMGYVLKMRRIRQILADRAKQRRGDTAQKGHLTDTVAELVDHSVDQHRYLRYADWLFWLQLRRVAAPLLQRTENTQRRRVWRLWQVFVVGTYRKHGGAVGASKPGEISARDMVTARSGGVVLTHRRGVVGEGTSAQSADDGLSTPIRRDNRAKETEADRRLQAMSANPDICLRVTKYSSAVVSSRDAGAQSRGGGVRKRGAVSPTAAKMPNSNPAAWEVTEEDQLRYLTPFDPGTDYVPPMFLSYAGLARSAGKASPTSLGSLTLEVSLGSSCPRRAIVLSAHTSLPVAEFREALLEEEAKMATVAKLREQNEHPITSADAASDDDAGQAACRASRNERQYRREAALLRLIRAYRHYLSPLDMSTIRRFALGGLQYVERREQDTLEGGDEGSGSIRRKGRRGYYSALCSSDEEGEEHALDCDALTASASSFMSVASTGEGVFTDGYTTGGGEASPPRRINTDGTELSRGTSARVDRLKELALPKSSGEHNAVGGGGDVGSHRIGGAYQRDPCNPQSRAYKQRLDAILALHRRVGGLARSSRPLTTFDAAQRCGGDINAPLSLEELRRRGRHRAERKRAAAERVTARRAAERKMLVARECEGDHSSALRRIASGFMAGSDRRRGQGEVPPTPVRSYGHRRPTSGRARAALNTGSSPHSKGDDSHASPSFATEAERVSSGGDGDAVSDAENGEGPSNLAGRRGSASFNTASSSGAPFTSARGPPVVALFRRMRRGMPFVPYLAGTLQLLSTEQREREEKQRRRREREERRRRRVANADVGALCPLSPPAVVPLRPGTVMPGFSLAAVPCAGLTLQHQLALELMPVNQYRTRMIFFLKWVRWAESSLEARNRAIFLSQSMKTMLLANKNNTLRVYYKLWREAIEIIVRRRNRERAVVVGGPSAAGHSGAHRRSSAGQQPSQQRRKSSHYAAGGSLGEGVQSQGHASVGGGSQSVVPVNATNNPSVASSSSARFPPQEGHTTAVVSPSRHGALSASRLAALDVDYRQHDGPHNNNQTFGNARGRAVGGGGEDNDAEGALIADCSMAAQPTMLWD